MNTAPNLTQRPPRSPRVRLGGYVLLARLLDKGRAELAGTAGEYKYNNPIDRHWFRFTGITPESLKAELAGVIPVNRNQCRSIGLWYLYSPAVPASSARPLSRTRARMT